MKRVREESVVFGKQSIQARLKKARSILSRVGEDLLFDQVKRRSSSGNSRRARSLRVSLKAFASF